MALTINLTINASPELEKLMLEEAQKQGVSVQEYAQNWVEGLERAMAAARVGTGTAGKSQNAEAFLSVLDSFLEQEEREHRETLELLRRVVDEDRPGQRSVFGEGTNPDGVS